MSNTLWLVASLAMLAVIVLRNAPAVLMRPSKRVNDFERCIGFAAVFALSWSGGNVLFAV